MLYERNLRFGLIACLCGITLIGCARQQLLKQNVDNGLQIVASVYVYCDQDFSRTGLPTRLNELVSVGILKEIPKCKCADGKMRDFIYISGFHEKESDYVFLASPPEMDPKVSIVYFGAEPKILSRSEAAKEIERSCAFVKALPVVESK